MTDTTPDDEYLIGPTPPRFSLGDINDALAHLRKAADFATAERFVPGLAIAVVVREKGGCRVACCDGFGVKNVQGAEKPGADTLFPCASVSKPVSATLLAAGKARWDEVVYQRNGQPYKLEQAPKPTPTLRQWLSHISGLPDHAGDLIEDMNPSISRDGIIDRIMKFQTGLVPNVYHYGNFGFTIGCLGAAHALSKSGWEDFSKAALGVLGMRRSTYDFTSAFASNAGDRVVPHRGKPASEGDGWQWRVVKENEERNPWRQAPAASLISSACDMAVFLRAHLEGRFTDFPQRDPKEYSLGWNVADHSDEPAFKGAINATSFSHSGAFTLGAATCLRIDPGAGVGIVVLTNAEPVGVAEFLVRIFFNCLYSQPGSDRFKTNGQLDYGKVFREGRKKMLGLLNEKKNENIARYPSAAQQPIPAEIPPGLFFRGHSDYYGDAVIDRNGKELWLSLLEKDDGRLLWRFPLRYYGGFPHLPVFVYDTIGENEVGPSGVRLVAPRDNRFHILVDDWLNQAPGAVGVFRSADALS